MAKIFDAFVTFLKQVGNFVTFDYLLIGSLALLLVLVLLCYLRTRRTYEVKLLKTVKNLNKYFIKNPTVTDENLVDFNNRMKMVPKTLRSCWQAYMLDREKSPSAYMNVDACVDQPSKTSGYKNTATTCGIFTIVIACLTVLIALARFDEDGAIRFNPFFFRAFLLPVCILILGFLFVAYLRARHTSIISDLYFEYHEFERGIDKFCSTMPPFIDYEVLFSKKEIKDGIPVLQEYLEKRKIQEQKEKEEAELNAIHYEEFDFDELGVDNSLLLERAMKESEKFFSVKSDLSEKARNKEAEMLNYQKNFDEVTKDYERKAQVLRESIKQLADQINATTIKIEANYMKKRQNEEQQKLQQLEKDYELASGRFNKQQSELQAEVDELNAEIAARKASTEEAMKAEGKTYANKVYNAVSKSVTEQSKPILEKAEEDKAALEDSIQKLNENIETKTVEFEELNSSYEKVEQDYKEKLAELAAIQNLKDYLVSDEFKSAIFNGNVPANNNDASIVSEEKDNEQLRRKEEEIKFANEKIKKYEIVTQEKEKKIKELEMQIQHLLLQQKEQSEIENRLKEQNRKLEANALALEKAQSRPNDAKKVDELLNIQKNIENENSNLLKQQEDLKHTIEQTILTLGDVGKKVANTAIQLDNTSKTAFVKESVTKPALKKEDAGEVKKPNPKNKDKIENSLGQLLSAVNKMQAKNMANKTVTNKARVNKNKK